MIIDKRAMTRRDFLRLGALASGAFLLGSQARGEVSNSGAIDVHGHLWTDEYLDLMEKFGKKDVGVQRGKGAGNSQAEIEKRFAMMDSAGIAMQALSICPQGPQFADKDHAVTAARKANDLYLEAVEKWPKRFVAYAAVPLPHVDESLKELDRMLGQPGFVGATIPTSILDRSIADPSFLPFTRSSIGAAVCYLFTRGLRRVLSVDSGFSSHLDDWRSDRRHRGRSTPDSSRNTSEISEAEDNQHSHRRSPSDADATAR